MPRDGIMELAEATVNHSVFPTSRTNTDDSIELSDTSQPNQLSNANIKAIWKAVEAPQSTFTLENSKFYLPEGPLANDHFWFPTTKGLRAIVDRHGPHLGDSDDSDVRIEKTQKPFLFMCDSLIADFRLRPLQCFVVRGEFMEECMVRKLQTSARVATERLAKSMGGLLWYRVQNFGGIRHLLPRDIAWSLSHTAEAIWTFTELAGRLVETMRRRNTGDVCVVFRRVLQLLGLVEWYRIHRALNAVQVLEKAFDGLTSQTAPKQMSSQACIGHNMLGMLGWRLGPESLGEQQGALSDGFHSLHILDNTNWLDFDAEEAAGKMKQRSAGVYLVKDNFFSAWTFGTVLRFLTHQSMECGWSAKELVRCPGPSHFNGHLRVAHLEMLKTLPWVENFTGMDYVRLRFHPEVQDGLCKGLYEGYPEERKEQKAAWSWLPSINF